MASSCLCVSAVFALPGATPVQVDSYKGTKVYLYDRRSLSDA